MVNATNVISVNAIVSLSLSYIVFHTLCKQKAIRSPHVLFCLLRYDTLIFLVKKQHFFGFAEQFLQHDLSIFSDFPVQLCFFLPISYFFQFSLAFVSMVHYFWLLFVSMHFLTASTESKCAKAHMSFITRNSVVWSPATIIFCFAKLLPTA